MLRETDVVVVQLALLKLFSLSSWSSLMLLSGTYQAQHSELVVGGWKATVHLNHRVLKVIVTEIDRLAYAISSQREVFPKCSNFYTCITCGPMQMLKQFSHLIWNSQILYRLQIWRIRKSSVGKVLATHGWGQKFGSQRPWKSCNWESLDSQHPGGGGGRPEDPAH